MTWSAVPEPPGVAPLPHDHRGVPIPVHVPRSPGKPPKITVQDPERLVIVAATRRCAICGWRIRDDERLWYFSWPPAVEQNRASGWVGWDHALEGFGHRECMLYAAVACPFFADGRYERKTDQRNFWGQVTVPRGERRHDFVLAGATRMIVHMTRPDEPPDHLFRVLLGGGEPEMLVFGDGVELLPELEAELASCDRTPDEADLEMAAILTSDDRGPVRLRAMQTMAMLAGFQELRFPFRVGRNDRCPCGSGSKTKFCCMRLHENSRAAAAEVAPSGHNRDTRGRETTGNVDN